LYSKSVGDGLLPSYFRWKMSNTKWHMGDKAKSRCRLGRLKVKDLRHSNLNILKLEKWSQMRECFNNYHLTVHFLIFAITFKIQKVQKWQIPFWNLYLRKSRI
jgi:hypothetical protein